MRMNNNIEQIINAFEKSSKIAITGHVNPDGDAVGACLGLGLTLKSAGKTVDVYLENFSEAFRCIPGSGIILKDTDFSGEYDLFIAVDCAEKNRISENLIGFYKSAPLTVNIDHHTSNDFFGKLNYVDENASSASEIVYRIIRDSYDIPKTAAAALYAGMVYDTGGFRHTCTSPLTMAAAADMMSQGINFSEIYNEIFNRHSFVEAKLMGAALNRLEMKFGGRVACTYLTLEEIAALGGTSKDVSEIINYIKGVRGAVAAVFAYEKAEGESKVSLRGDDPINVAEISACFGGGGHIRAAGCTVYMGAEDAMNMVLDKLGECFIK